MNNSAVTTRQREQPLYRPEILAEERTDWLGKVVLITPPSARAFALLAVFIIAAFGLLMTFASFTNKVHVNGWLVSKNGQSRIVASQPGVVTELLVQEGARVVAGDPLLTISSEQRSSLGATQAEIARLLSDRRASLKTQIGRQRKLFGQQRQGLVRRISAMRREIGQLNQEIAVQKNRVDLAQRSSDRLAKLREQGFVSLAQTQNQDQLTLEQSAKLRELGRELAQRERELVSLRAELNELPTRAEVGLADLNREISELDQAAAQTEARRELIVTAPQSGTVSGLQTSVGAAASPNTLLMSIVPEQSDLLVHLFGSTKAIGFVKPGQQVKLTYDAYPYQKFGHHPGEIIAVSRAALSPADLPRELTGLSELFTGTEPIYRIVVKPEKQTVIAYGESQQLQPGMRLAADVLIESRRLYEWVLDPLYTLTGRL